MGDPLKRSCSVETLTKVGRGIFESNKVIRTTAKPFPIELLRDPEPEFGCVAGLLGSSEISFLLCKYSELKTHNIINQVFGRKHSRKRCDDSHKNGF